jgi:hypothetical protein
MPLYQVSYDLHSFANRPQPDYESLYEALDGLLAVPILESTWLLASSSSAAQINDYLLGFIHEQDSLFISEVNSNCEGWLPNWIWTAIRKSRTPAARSISANIWASTSGR